MDSKYYVPEPEELHIGFEYEVNCFIGTDTDMYYGYVNNTKNNQWCQFVFPDKFTGYDLDKLFKNKIRVKYLDIDDIESLGWEQQFEGEYSFSKIGYRLFYDYEVKHMTILHYHSGDYLFIGIIKNKSELKKLLTQLNII